MILLQSVSGLVIHPSLLNRLHSSHLRFWLWWHPYAGLSAACVVQTESHPSRASDVMPVHAERTRLSPSLWCMSHFNAAAINGGSVISLLYADGSSPPLMYKLHLSILLNIWPRIKALEWNTLISYDAARQANKSCGSTLMDCFSLSCWGRCAMVKRHYCFHNEAPCEAYPPPRAATVVPAGPYLGLRHRTR